MISMPEAKWKQYVKPIDQKSKERTLRAGEIVRNRVGKEKSRREQVGRFRME